MSDSPLNVRKINRRGNGEEKSAATPRSFPKPKLFSRDCSRRASVLARTAIDASVGVYYVRLVAGCDRTDGTSIRACAAGYASIRNFVSHHSTSIC